MRIPPPSYIQLYPTARCNQSCSFCFNGNIHTTDLTSENAGKLLDMLSGNSIREIDIMGGEPFLLSWMPDFIETASEEKNMAVNISTNGSRPDMIQKCRSFNPRRVTIGISLEGSTMNRHNSLTDSTHFDAAIESIRLLVSWSLDPVVKTVLLKSSLDDIQNIIDLLRDIGVRRYCLLHMDVMSRSELMEKESQNYNAFITFFNRIRETNPDMSISCVHASCFRRDSLVNGTRCAAGLRKLAIMPDGSAFPCNLFLSMNEFNLGNIFREGLPDIWESPLLERFRNFKENKCSIDSCTNKPDCTGGCPAHGYYHFGNCDSPDIRCMHNT